MSGKLLMVIVIVILLILLVSCRRKDGYTPDIRYGCRDNIKVKCGHYINAHEHPVFFDKCIHLGNMICSNTLVDYESCVDLVEKECNNEGVLNDCYERIEICKRLFDY